MEKLFEFFGNYGTLIQIVAYILIFILSIILSRKTGDSKYLKEAIDMIKYRTNNQTPADFKPQEFERYKPVYRLNKATNELELTDEVIDIQELVNSCKDVALNAVLDRFLPTSQTEQVVEVARMQDDVDRMRDALNLADAYREKYNLPADMSASDIFKTVESKSNELKKLLEGKTYEEEKIIEESK